jgi:hypothetical protein
LSDRERIKVSGLRTLGAPGKPKAAKPKRSKSAGATADKARKVLRVEFRKALELKQKLADEAKVGGEEKGHAPARQAEKLRSLVASLEGMSRFAIAMGILTPAENRALWADAIKKGLYQGWR